MRILRVSLLLASLALPAAAQSRFGLGLDLLFEHQESLEVSAFRGTILTRDLLNGGEQSAEQPSDPALLNRKFDFLWELEAAGVELPIDLPGLWGLDPKLVLQAGVADVSLDFLGRRDPADNAGLSGRGPLFGVELDVEGSPWGAGPWSWGGSLRWQRVPSLTMDRSPAFRPEGLEAIADGAQPSQQVFEVMGDDVRLSQEVQELTTRVGYSASSGRAKTYLGVRHRRTSLTIEDELSYVDPLGEIETRLASRTELKSEVTLAVAGVEAHFGSLIGRLETAMGEGDLVVLAEVMYRLRDGRSGDLSSDRVAKMAAQVEHIRAEFLEARGELPVIAGPNGVVAFPIEPVVDLINRTEQALVKVLNGPQLAAMRDYVRNRAAQARQRLRLDLRPSAAMTIRRPRIAYADLRSISAHELSSSGPRLLSQRGADSADTVGALDLVNTVIDTLLRRLSDNDVRVDVCVRTVPMVSTTVTTVRIRPESSPRPNPKVSPTNGWLEHVPRGDYLFRVARDRVKIIDCLPGANPTLGECDPWDLMGYDKPVVTCNLKTLECDVKEEGSFVRFKC